VENLGLCPAVRPLTRVYLPTPECLNRSPSVEAVEISN
jgi:hypothetical protein